MVDLISILTIAMNDHDAFVFAGLFKEACFRCFGHPLQMPLSETESKALGNDILEHTGLVIGWKSLKNYSFYVLNDPAGKKENPSVATLDTLARYVLNAPYTDEIQRKNKEGHYPWWFQYKEQVHRLPQKDIVPKRRLTRVVPFVALAFVIILFILLYPFRPEPERFTDDFHTVAEDSLLQRGWWVQSKDTIWWNKRAVKPEHLTLFTLRGDNWPDTAAAVTPDIKNLLIRKIPSDCFTAEVHLTGFVPLQNWQQAGILLLEDTGFTGKSVRVSLAYNDYSGGGPVAKEILIQAITSLGSGFAKPEEIAHKHLFYLQQDSASFITDNLQHAALRIEKQGNRLRLLYANGAMPNSAFKELVSQPFEIRPAYIALFALKGFVQDADDIPAYFKFFSINGSVCDK